MWALMMAEAAPTKRIVVDMGVGGRLMMTPEDPLINVNFNLST